MSKIYKIWYLSISTTLFFILLLASCRDNKAGNLEIRNKELEQRITQLEELLLNNEFLLNDFNEGMLALKDSLSEILKESDIIEYKKQTGNPSLGFKEEVERLRQQLSSSQAQIKELQQALSKSNNSEVVRTGNIIVEQFNAQIAALQNKIDDLEARNQELLSDLSKSRTLLVQTEQELAEVIKNDSAKISQLEKDLDDEAKRTKALTEEAENQRILLNGNKQLALGKLKIEAIAPFLNANGNRIKNKHKEQATLYAREALEHFQKAQAAGISESTRYIRQLQSVEPYRELLGIRNPININN